MSRKVFQFKQFKVDDNGSAMKLGVDGVLLGAWAQHQNPAKILDIGTGSGVIALQMAQRFTNAQITALESNLNAFEQANKNFQASQWNNRINVLHTKFQNANFQQTFDCIICNPPFYKGDSLKDNPDRHEARSATFLPLKELLSFSKKIMHNTSKLFIVYPSEFENEVREECSMLNLYISKICYVKGLPNNPIKRMMLEIGLENCPTESTHLVVKESPEVFTKEYLEIVKDFYLFIES